MSWRVIEGEALAVLKTLPSESVDCCVTSPPYWRLRNYKGHSDQLGMEPTVFEYVNRVVEIFDEVRRVLHPTGTCWVNLGDTYIGRGGGKGTSEYSRRRFSPDAAIPNKSSPGLKVGDLAGAPWRVALAMQDSGWYLRADNIWHKTNAQQTGISSRPQTAHEYVFMFSKCPPGEYFYDADAVRTPLKPRTATTWGTQRRSHGHDGSGKVLSHNFATSCPDRRPALDAHGNPKGAHLRTVWPISVNVKRTDHYAVQPDKVARCCILAGCPIGGVVLDPFAGSGTTGRVALQLGREFIGIELVPEYAELARRSIVDDSPLFNRKAGT